MIVGRRSIMALVVFSVAGCVAVKPTPLAKEATDEIPDEKAAPAASSLFVVADVVAISVTVESWGTITSEWSVSRDGRGRYASRQDDDFTFTVSEAEFEHIASLGNDAQLGGGYCGLVMDAPMGQIKWRLKNGQEISMPFRLGPCRDADYQRFMNSLDAAWDLVFARKSAT